MAKATEIVRAIKPKDALGNPAKYMADNFKRDENSGKFIDGQTYLLGAIYGRAEAVKVVTRMLSSGEAETRFALAGNFSALPADANRAPQNAPVLWLPDHLHNAVAQMLRDQGKGRDENPEGAGFVDLAFEVGIKSSQKGGYGFEWTYTPKTELTPATDPLAHLAALFGSAVSPALPSPSTDREGVEGENVADSETITDPASDEVAEVATGRKRNR